VRALLLLELRLLLDTYILTIRTVSESIHIGDERAQAKDSRGMEASKERKT
jgi:hypothetical protein